MPIAAPAPKPEPAPVMRIVFAMRFSFRFDLVKLWMRVKGGDSRLGDFEVLRDSAAGNADGADYFASRALQQDAAGERRQSAIAEFQRGSGCARLAVFPNRLA